MASNELPRTRLARRAIASTDRTVWAVLAISVVVFALRLSQISQSLIGDETFTYTDIIGRSFRAVLSGVHTGGENSPPLFFLLAWGSIKLGDPTEWIRLPSVVLGAATLPVVYGIGRLTIGRAPALLATVMLALSPFTLYYGTEARPYATMVFFVALSTLALLNAVASGSPRWWTLYALAVAAAAYTHYTAIFALGAQAAWSLWQTRRRVLSAVVANGAVAVLYLPWLPHVRGKALAVIGGLEHLNVSNVLGDFLRVVMGYPYGYLRQIPTWYGVAVFLGCVAVGLAFVVRERARRRPAPAEAPVRAPGGQPADTAPASAGAGGLRLLTLLAVATPVGLLLYSLLDVDLWLARGLSASLPAIVLLLAYVLLRPPVPVRYVTVGLALAVLAFGMAKALTTSYRRGPYRQVAAYLDRHATASEPVVYLSIVGAPAVGTMYKRPHTILSTNQAHDQTPPGGRAWVVLDDFLMRGLHVRLNHILIGFRLVQHKHFDGLFPTELLAYERP